MTCEALSIALLVAASSMVMSIHTALARAVSSNDGFGDQDLTCGASRGIPR